MSQSRNMSSAVMRLGGGSIGTSVSSGTVGGRIVRQHWHLGV